ncbi:MAG: hypothetical protein ACOYVK_13850 [Bacillota bacterium]
MKKLVALLLVSFLAFGAVGSPVFANEDLAIEEEVFVVEEEIEIMEEEITADIQEEEVMEAVYGTYKQLKDEFRALYAERKITRELTKEIAKDRVKVAALKEKARIKGEDHKLKAANLVEKEIKVFKTAIERIRKEKHELWSTFKEQIRNGKIDQAENTLKKIVVSKKLINENLKHIHRLLEKEIQILN